MIFSLFHFFLFQTYYFIYIWDTFSFHYTYYIFHIIIFSFAPSLFIAFSSISLFIYVSHYYSLLSYTLFHWYSPHSYFIFIIKIFILFIIIEIHTYSHFIDIFISFLLDIFSFFDLSSFYVIRISLLLLHMTYTYTDISHIFISEHIFYIIITLYIFFIINFHYIFLFTFIFPIIRHLHIESLDTLYDIRHTYFISHIMILFL